MKTSLLPVKHIKKLYIYVDGCSKNNPGHSAIGIVIADETGTVIREYKEYIGKTTNQVAEYLALEKGLNLASGYTANKLVKLVVFSDSELVIKQMKKKFQIKAPHLLEIYKRIRNAERMFKEIEYIHASQDNKLVKKADKLADVAVREKLVEDILKTFDELKRSDGTGRFKCEN